MTTERAELLAREHASSVDPKAEYEAFCIWARNQYPHASEPPAAASSLFGAWVGSARHRIEALSAAPRDREAIAREDGPWVTITAERAHYVSEGREMILCDRLPSPITLVLKNPVIQDGASLPSAIADDFRTSLADRGDTSAALSPPAIAPEGFVVDREAVTPPVSYADFQQRRGMLPDIIESAIAEYDEWMKDDHYDAHVPLDKIIERLKSARDIYDPSVLAAAETAPPK